MRLLVSAFVPGNTLQMHGVKCTISQDYGVHKEYGAWYVLRRSQWKYGYYLLLISS